MFAGQWHPLRDLTFFSLCRAEKKIAWVAKITIEVITTICTIFLMEILNLITKRLNKKDLFFIHDLYLSDLQFQ